MAGSERPGGMDNLKINRTPRTQRTPKPTNTMDKVKKIAAGPVGSQSRKGRR